MNKKLKLTLGYLWVIGASLVFLAAVQSLSAGGPSGAGIIGYIMTFGYVILRWSLVAGKMEIKSQWVSRLLSGYVLLCAFLIFSGVSGFHGGSEEGKMFAAVIALVMAIETGRQIKRLSMLSNPPAHTD